MRLIRLVHDAQYFLLFLLGAGVWLPAHVGAQTAVIPKSISLAECLGLAKRHNPLLAAYDKRHLQNVERQRGVDAQLYPRLDLGLGYDRLSDVPLTKKPYMGDTRNDMQINALLSWPLFTGGRLNAEQESARIAIDTARHDFRAVSSSVAFNVKSAYHRLLFAQEVFTSKQDLLRYAASFYDVALALHTRTKIPRLENVLRIQVQLNEVRHDLLLAGQNRELAVNQLWNAIGLDPVPATIVDTNQSTGGKVYILANEWATVQRSNPEIARAAKELEKAERMVALAKSRYFPQVNVHAQYSHAFSTYSSRDSWYAGLSATFALGDFFKTQAEVGQWNAYREEIAAYQKQVLLKIRLSLQSTLLQYEVASQRVAVSRQNEISARTCMDLFERRYRSGLLTSYELLDSQKSFALAQMSYVSSVLDLRLAEAEIERLKFDETL